MKKYSFLLLILLSLSISLKAQTCAANNNQWQNLGSGFNLWRYNSFNFVIGNKAYVGGGSYNWNKLLELRNDYGVYDAASNTWSAIANLPATGISGSYDGVGFSVGGKGYLFYGKTVSAGASVYAGKFYEYDPKTNIWTDRSSALTGKDQLLYSSSLVAMSINGKVYIGGGSYATAANGAPIAMTKWYVFTPSGTISTNSFTEFQPGTPGTGAPGSGDNYMPCSFVIGNYGYVFSYTKLWKFDPDNLSFTDLAPTTTYPYPEVVRVNQIAFAIGNKGYVGFGNHSTGSSSGLYEYNPTNNTWNSTNLNASTIVTARHSATAFSIADKAYLYGGVTNWPSAASVDNQFYYFTGSIQTVLKTVLFSASTNTYNLCPGSSFPVTYLKNCQPAFASTLLTVQLSDVNGLFSTSSPSIGTTNVTGSDVTNTITCTIPSNTTAGTKYRVRVVADGGYTGLDNGTDITIAAAGGAGTISHPYSVPFPSEKIPDSIKSTSPATGASSYLWQRSTDNSTWTTIFAATAVNYTLLNTDNIDVYYRRGANLACLATVFTPSVMLRVYSASNSRLNGAISGKVTSRNGVGVFGITITAKKNTALLGSPVTKTYTTTTDQSGVYTIPSIFYGDLNAGDPASVVFTITPSLPNHNFSPTTTIATLSQQIPSVGSKDFTDNSTYSITGKVTQFCSTCDVNFQSDSLNGVQIGIANNGVSFPSSTTGSGSEGYGRFALNVTDPGTYRLTPSKKNHLFSPSFRDTTVVASNIDRVVFADTTQYTISGVFKAGANQSIGTVQLVFSDTVLGRTSKFKRTVTTAADGSYSVKLPARKYKVFVNTFTPSTSGADITVNDLLTWFNTTLKDSNYVDIDTSNKTFNLIYHRAPVLVIDNLPDTTCDNYVAFKQYEARNFAFEIYEGDPVYECLLSYDTVSKIKLTTNVHKEDVNEILEYKPINGVAAVSLKGGSPNIVANYNKFFSATFKDKYNRQSAILTRNVKVLGTKADPGTFTTVSPEVPILILHAPPGDQSTSTWERTQTTETAMRFSAVTNRTTGGFVDVTIGTAFEAGIGMSIETSIWANVNASLSNTQRVINNSEAIISSSTTVGYATSPNGGDVFVGGALNLTYAVANELKYSSACVLELKSSLVIAPKGFATTYTYSESFITETLIPSLRFIANYSPDSAAKYLNQIKVWEQVIANNNANKERAEFVRNRSFDGNAGAITESTTSSASQSNSLEFEVEVNSDIAISAGFEIGGSGLNGGVNIGFKMTTGSSSTNTNTSSTTMGYTLDDDDTGDYFSVDIKKDPVYSTPVFVLVAGTASCPAEPIAQSRDNVQLTIPTPEIRNIPANEEVLFQLRLQNTSESRETRTYFLTFNQSSNPNGALVTIGGSPVTSNISYTIPYLGSQTVTVAVRKSASSNIYSYEGLEFTLSDACDGGVEKSNTISAHFISPCSNLILNAPVNNWIVKSSDNNILPVEYTGYNLSNLQSVALEYARAGRGDWATDTIIYQNFISNPTSSILYWNIADIAEGEYDIRMKLNCLSGSGYTQRLTGIIDRTAPRLFGLPQPTDRNYVSGDEISMSFTENLQTNNLNNNKVTMTRILDGSDIPVQVSGYQNKVMILPMINLSTFASGEAIRIVAKQIADIYGNESSVLDTFFFNVGASVATNSNRKVTLSNAVATKRAVFENTGDSLQIKFSVTTASAYNTVVNYLVSGSAQFESDYANSFSSGQNLTTEFNGTQGTINIPANATSAILRIKPIADDDIEANETVTIKLLSGGDYKLGADSLIVITDTIKNDDLSQPVITMGGLVGTPTTICQGGTAVLSTADYIDGIPVYAYLWKSGNNIIGTSRNININAAGIYTLKVYTANGFSGVSMPHIVTANAAPTSDVYAEVCSSQLPYNWNGTIYSTTGNYSKTISNANGCDSIATLHLTVKSNSYSVETISAIDTYEWHGTVYNASTNTATWTGVNEVGCDSIVTLHLNITYTCVPTNTILFVTRCGSYTWNGMRFFSSTVVEWVGSNSRGCDSIVMLNLTINNATSSTTNNTICANQLPFSWNGLNFNSGGQYTKHFLNAKGCDSTAYLILTVLAPSNSVINTSVCSDELPFVWDGVNYNSTGSYVRNYTNAYGCDSAVTLVLSVKQVTASNKYLSICTNQLPLIWNGLTLTATGSYTANFNNVNGCDSFAILNLTVKQLSNVIETIAAIGSSYNWHGTTYTTSNYTATWVGINAAGCDSVVTLNLTLTNDCVPTENISYVTACNVYFWRGIRLTTSTTLEWVGVNAGGCDSVEILILTITNVSPSATPASITQTLVSNVCGARVYRYTAASVTNAEGYNWTLPISVGGVSGVFVDSGDATNSRIILVRYASTLAAFTTDSIKVRAYSACGTTGNRSAKLLNTLFTVPTTPASITITPIVTNVCGAKRYRYAAPALPAATSTTEGATGYIWVFTGVLGASIDSGNVNSKVITVTFSSNAAAATGDSIKLAYSSLCGNSLYKASKLTNALLSVPAAPTVTVTPVQTNVCGARKFRYTASALTAASTTSGAATGWLWSLPAEGIVGSTGVLDSGSIVAQTIVVVFSSNAAAVTGDSIRVAYTSVCGLGVAKATKLTNTSIVAPLAPATVTVTPLVTNICGARKYRYTAAGLVASTTTATAATGWLWSLPAEGTVGSTGTLDSGSINGQTIVMVYSSNAAAIAGDSIRVSYTSGCGLGVAKATKLTNTLLGAPLAPATVTIATVSDICGARVYRYTAPSLAIATTTAGAARGYLWSLPIGTLGLTGVLDSGSLTSQVIRIRYSSNVAAATGDSIKVLYTSDCGNSPAKAQKLSNLAPTLLAASATLTGTTSICSVVGTATSNRYIASAVTGAVSYVWTLPAGAVLDSGSNGLKIKVRFLTAGANDSIFVQAVGTNGCAGSKKVLKLVTTGCVTQLIARTNLPSTIKTSIDPMKVNVYPNPTTNAFQMFVKTPTASKITMRVLDIQGRLIKTNSFNSDETIAFGNDLKSGVFMVEVREGNEVKTVRVVKY